jgi:NAD+ synthase
VGLEQMIELAQLNPEKAVCQIESFIAGYIQKAGMKGAVIGLSGGVDSAVAGAIAVRAFQGTSLKLRAYYMPSSVNTEEDKALVEVLAGKLGLKCKTLPIQNILDGFSASNNTFKEELQLGNAAASVRMAQLSAEASLHKSLVLGTGNRDEYFLGYFTKRGDGAADLMPLLSLSKRMVLQLGRYLGVPTAILKRPPTAGLWEGQTDEAELGFSYSEAELIINGFLAGYTIEEITRLTGLEQTKVERVHQLHLASAHKRSPPPFADVEFNPPNSKPTLAECNNAMIIGRFQMVHLGHVDMFYQIKEHPNIKQLLIGVGSRGNTRDPGEKYLFSYSEAKQLIEPLAKELGLPYIIREVPDINDNLRYAEHVASIFPELNPRTAIITGEPRTIKCFDFRYPILRPEFRINIHSSRIRELIAEGKPYEHLVHNAESMKMINYEAHLKSCLGE